MGASASRSPVAELQRSKFPADPARLQRLAPAAAAPRQVRPGAGVPGVRSQWPR